MRSMTTQDTRGNLHDNGGRFSEKQHTADEVTLARTGPAKTAPTKMSDLFRKRALDQMDRIAGDLEELAAKVRHNKRFVEDDPVAGAAQLIHDTSWAYANLNLDSVVHAARDVQSAVAAEKQQEADAFMKALENARDVEYEDAGSELRGSNGTVRYDAAALDAAIAKFRGE